jgi:chemotaxis protein MotB
MTAKIRKVLLFVQTHSFSDQKISPFFMRTVRFFALGLALICYSACVSTKVHRAELSAREQCEAREKILVQEVLERRKETTKLIETVGSLNRSLGSQDAELRDLKLELTNRTLQMGESSSKLAIEKTAIERELAGKTAQLEQREAALESIASVQRSQQNILDDIRNTLSKNYSASGNSVEVAERSVLVTLADEILFDKTGTSVSAEGQKLLQVLANLFLNRPELEVQVLAYTDNQLPKGAKGLNDTWDWSLLRATNIVRLLTREFNVNANQLTPVAKGEFYPVTSNETSAGRQKNRRTVIAIYPSLPKVPRL